MLEEIALLSHACVDTILPFLPLRRAATHQNAMLSRLLLHLQLFVLGCHRQRTAHPHTRVDYCLCATAKYVCVLQQVGIAGDYIARTSWVLHQYRRCAGSDPDWPQCRCLTVTQKQPQVQLHSGRRHSGGKHSGRGARGGRD